MLNLIALTAALSSTALAADLNGDGCEDSYYDANAACVAPSAHLGSGVTVGAGAVIADRAIVGADSEIGANVIVARRAVVGERTTLGSGSTVGRSAVVGSDVDASAGGLTLGYGAELGDSCVVGWNVTLGSLVSVGTDCNLGTGVILARSASIGPRATLGASVVLGPAVVAGSDLTVAARVRVRKNVSFGNRVSVGQDTSIGRDVLIDDDVVVGADVRLSARVEVAAESTIEDDSVVGRGITIDNRPLDPCEQAFGVACSEFAWDYLKASNTAASDTFGWDVALSGDTLAISALGEDSSATGINGNQSNGANSSGAVFIFTRTEGVWSQQAYIKASNTASSDEFGRSIALDGDTLAVGSAAEDSGSTGVNGDQASNSVYNSGAVYVFTRSDGTWSQQAYVKASNPDPNDNFGFSVSLSGDTLAVGAKGEGSSATGVGGDQTSNDFPNAGAAYVFTRSGSTWSQQAYIKASNTEADDLFGYEVAVSGDSLAVGAVGEDSTATLVNGSQNLAGASSSGAVYVFTRNGGVWSQQAYLKGATTSSGNQFGWALDMDGDTIAVGSNAEDSVANNSGSVDVFERTDGSWSHQGLLKASNAGDSDRFGWSVCVSGDTIAVGAPYENGAAVNLNGNESSEGATDGGAAYVFTRSDGSWSQLAYVKASNTNESDLYGNAIAIEEGGALAVGAYFEWSSATGINGNQSLNDAFASGAVYVTRTP